MLSLIILWRPGGELLTLDFNFMFKSPGAEHSEDQENCKQQCTRKKPKKTTKKLPLEYGCQS